MSGLPSKLNGKHMTVMSYFRGHEIVVISGEWVYEDTGIPVKLVPERDCGHCGKASTPEGHDGCLGTLPGVMNACCGHGREEWAYVQYPDGTRITGKQAIIKQQRLREGQ